jgi:polypeptide N-acetylgalactosaminyltransferase
MKNVFPEKFIPNRNVQYYGRVESKHKGMCLDDMQQKQSYAYNLGAYQCHKQNNVVAGSQMLSLTNNGVLRTEISCATIDTK